MSAERSLQKNLLVDAGGIQVMAHNSVAPYGNVRSIAEALEIVEKSVKYTKAVMFPEYFIDSENTDSIDTVLNKVRALAECAAQHPDDPVSIRLSELFPGIAAEHSVRVPRAGPAGNPELPELPKVAPALWQRDKRPGDTPPDFILRHYEPWLGRGLTRPDIKKLDPQLYMALFNWLRKNSMPANFDLPTLKEANDRWVARVRANPSDLPTDPRDLARLGQAMQNRFGRT